MACKYNITVMPNPAIRRRLTIFPIPKNLKNKKISKQVEATKPLFELPRIREKVKRKAK